MGALNSIHDRLKEFSEAEEENEQEYSTPQRAMRQKCLTGIDPRSPTENIDRTPIIVEGTPNVQLSKGIKSRLASQNESPVDPRSPSSEFPRTPLVFGQTSSDSSNTPLRAPLHSMPPPNVKGEDSETRNESSQKIVPIEQQLCDILDQSSSSSDNDFVTTMEESQEESSYDTAPLLDGTEKLNQLSVHDERKSSSTSGQETETDDSFLSQSKPKCRSMNRILNQNTPKPIIKVRTALTPVENSPRVSKFPKKIVNTPGSKTNSGYMNSPVAVDKENVCH